MMTKYNRPLAFVLILVLTALLLFPVMVWARGISDVIKVLGIGAAVSAFGGQINDFINKALGEHQAQALGATKVVPIVSIGKGGYIGAAQVVGVPEQVRKVQAVVQPEINLGTFGGKALLPISTKSANKNFKPVTGVGVSAVIDFKI